jgi:hypothetical protein
MSRNGFNGPIPKRDDQRIRRNQPEVQTDKVEMIGEVEIPDLGLPDPHHLISDFYASLALSGQARYYEPSDWQFARITLHFLDKLLKSSKPSGQMLATITTSLSNLMVSEGDRRRLRMEVERNKGAGDSGENVVDIAEMFRRRLSGG